MTLDAEGKDAAPAEQSGTGRSTAAASATTTVAGPRGSSRVGVDVDRRSVEIALVAGVVVVLLAYLAANGEVDLLGTIAWPVAALVALYVLREPLAEFVGTIGGRVSKLSVGGLFSVDLRDVSQPSLPWVVGGLDARSAAPAHVFDSASGNLFEAMSKPGAADYIAVDLGTGQSWLTTRLYVFAVMLERMRDLRCIVFLATTGDGEDRFLGLISPDSVRWRLARRFPYLEQAYLAALSGRGASNIESDGGALPPWSATSVVNGFLQDLNIQVPEGQPPARRGAKQPNEQPVNTCPNGWVRLEGTEPSLCEHAQWLTASDPEAIFGLTRQVIEKQAVRHSLSTRPEDRVKNILRSDGHYVALVDSAWRFDRLIDRDDLLNRMALDVANS